MDEKEKASKRKMDGQEKQLRRQMNENEKDLKRQMDENEAVLRREIDEKERFLKSQLDKEKRFKYVSIAFAIIFLVLTILSQGEMKTQMESNEQALQTQLTSLYNFLYCIGGIAGILIMLIIRYIIIQSS